MKPAVVILVLAIFGLGSLSTTSCLVTRRSETYACSTDADCDGNRTCDRGYCVPAACPSQCTSCNLTTKTCAIDCSSSHTCGAVACPAGFDCTIKCTNTNACGTIDCSASTGCDVACSGMAACGALTCGTGVCKIDCVGSSSCGAVNCMDSCRCDVKCSNAPSCPSTVCPQPSGLYCTKDGTPDTVCDSTAATCNTCI